MSSVAPADLPIGKELADGEAAELAESEPGTKAARVKKRLTSRSATIASLVIAVVWTIPTFGLLVSSFRPAELIRTTGWWTIFQNPGFTLENYADRALLDVVVITAARRLLRELDRDHDPGDAVPAGLRGDGGLRVRVDQVQVA